MASTTYLTSNDTSSDTSQAVVALIGRILIAYLLIPSGFGKLIGFASTVSYIQSAGLPLPEMCAVVAIFIEVGLGMCFLLGFQTRISSVTLAIFTVLTALLFHQYWATPEAMKMAQAINFNKNIAIAGGLLTFAAFGPGRISVDKR